MGPFEIVSAIVSATVTGYRNFYKVVSYPINLNKAKKEARDALRSAEADARENVLKQIEGLDCLRFNVHDYLECCKLYGVDVANLCQNMTLNDVRTSFVYFLKERGL